mmetsp:Transcript_16786/g.47634  ORF Transcript_16786/g.47634 Transcript_16786/m.47634 type:complete len:187 (+) Transcript_16786:1311-1871(+)
MHGQRRRLGDLQISNPDRIMFTTLHFPPPAAADDDDDADDDDTDDDDDEDAHKLLFDASDGFIDLAYYASKEDCEANKDAHGWYIRDEDVGNLTHAANDCECHKGLTTDGVDDLSFFSCFYPEDKKLALSIFAGDMCTVNEMTQINVFNDEMLKLQEGNCTSATVLHIGENDKPATLYVRLEVDQE